MSGPPLRPDEQPGVARQRIGAQRDISVDRLPHGRHQRHDPRLAALAGDPHRLAQRQHPCGQAHGLGDAQSRAVKQQQDRKVARAEPIVGRGRSRLLRQRDRVRRACRPRQGARALRRARPRQLRRVALLLCREGQESAHSRHFPRRRGCAKPAPRRSARKARKSEARRFSRPKRPISSPRWRPRKSIRRWAVAT